MLYDGSPTYPHTDGLWQVVAEHDVTVFGAGAGYLLACAKEDLHPGKEYPLDALRAVGSTGSPLPASGFRWVQAGVGRRLPVVSISGGTDLVTAFIGGCPVLPIVAGELNCRRALGAAVEAWSDDGRTGHRGARRTGGHRADAVDAGVLLERPRRQPLPRRVLRQVPGRVVPRRLDHDHRPGICGRARPFGCHAEPRGGADGQRRHLRRRRACSRATGLRGRRGGAVQRRVLDAAVRPLADDAELDDDLRARINAAIRSGASPRHVPDEILAVPGIPRTITGKRLEIPIKRILLGAPPSDVVSPSAVDRPELLKVFAEYARP